MKSPHINLRSHTSAPMAHVHSYAYAQTCIHIYYTVIYVCVHVFLKIKEKCVVSQASIDSFVVCQSSLFSSKSNTPDFSPNCYYIGITRICRLEEIKCRLSLYVSGTRSRGAHAPE